MISYSCEIRLLRLMGVLMGSYAATVIGTALAVGQIGLLLNLHAISTIAVIWIAAFAFVFAAYGGDLLVRRRPERPIRAMLDDCRVHLLQPDVLLARCTIIGSFFLLLLLFNPFKIMIGHLRGFPLDHVLAAVDRLLFLGNDPWRLTHAVIGPIGTAILQFCYSTWFPMMWISLMYPLMRLELVRFRVQYLAAFMLTWIMVGSVAAWMLASAGPCYFERAFGDPYYAPLMTRIDMLNSQMEAMGLGRWALDVQDKLWNAYATNQGMFGGGISAMPSIHVAVSVLMMLGGYTLNRRLGHALAVFAFVIWVASVHLAWHYAVDGIVAGAMTFGIWKFSGWLVERYVLGEQPAALPQPALAE